MRSWACAHVCSYASRCARACACARVRTFLRAHARALARVCGACLRACVRVRAREGECARRVRTCSLPPPSLSVRARRLLESRLLLRVFSLEALSLSLEREGGRERQRGSKEERTSTAVRGCACNPVFSPPLRGIEGEGRDGGRGRERASSASCLRFYLLLSIDPSACHSTPPPPPPPFFFLSLSARAPTHACTRTHTRARKRAGTHARTHALSGSRRRPTSSTTLRM
jgi:hypothetical protein